MLEVINIGWGAPHSSDRKSSFLRWIAAVGPVGTVKKPSVLGEVFFKPLWESAFFADFHPRRQFPQALVSLSFLLLFSFSAFSTRKFCARIAEDRRSLRRSTGSTPLLPFPGAAFRLPK